MQICTRMTIIWEQAHVCSNAFNIFFFPNIRSPDMVCLGFKFTQTCCIHIMGDVRNMCIAFKIKCPPHSLGTCNSGAPLVSLHTTKRPLTTLQISFSSS